MRALAPCGTTAAYARHKRRGEPLDQACIDAHNAQSLESRQRLHPLKGPRELQPCGTMAAYQRHWLWSEPICDACREARNAWYRAYRKRRKDAGT